MRVRLVQVHGVSMGDHMTETVAVHDTKRSTVVNEGKSTLFMKVSFHQISLTTAVGVTIAIPDHGSHVHDVLWCNGAVLHCKIGQNRTGNALPPTFRVQEYEESASAINQNFGLSGILEPDG